MSLVDEMRNLREDIDNEKEARTRRLKEIKAGLAEFMKDARSKRREEFQLLREELKSFIADLEKGTQTSLRENREAQQELKKMLDEASAAYWGKVKL